jgi:hypothetical protein
MDPMRLFFIFALIGFVISGRKFMDAWRDESDRGRPRRYIFGGLCLAFFVAMGFFELPG